MTEFRIRHLPVMENEIVVGVVSIGDLVNRPFHRQEEQIQHLHHYIAGSYPGLIRGARGTLIQSVSMSTEDIYEPSVESFVRRAHCPSKESNSIAICTASGTDPKRSGPRLPNRKSIGSENGLRLLEWNPPFASRWFAGAKTNLSYNCLTPRGHAPQE
jgi:hypothetical protein